MKLTKKEETWVEPCMLTVVAFSEHQKEMLNIER